MGDSWNEPFPKVSLILDGMRTVRRSPYSSAPAPSGGMGGSCLLLCFIIKGMAGKRAGVAKWCPGSFSLCIVRGHQQLRVKSLFICCTSNTSGITCSRQLTKPLWSSAFFLHFQSYCSRYEQVSSSSKYMPFYRAENLQKWGFSPPE